MYFLGKIRLVLNCPCIYLYNCDNFGEDKLFNGKPLEGANMKKLFLLTSAAILLSGCYSFNPDATANKAAKGQVTAEKWKSSFADVDTNFTMNSTTTYTTGEILTTVTMKAEYASYGNHVITQSTTKNSDGSDIVSDPYEIYVEYIDNGFSIYNYDNETNEWTKQNFAIQYPDTNVYSLEYIDLSASYADFNYDAEKGGYYCESISITYNISNKEYKVTMNNILVIFDNEKLSSLSLEITDGITAMAIAYDSFGTTSFTFPEAKLIDNGN